MIKYLNLFEISYITDEQYYFKGFSWYKNKIENKIQDKNLQRDCLKLIEGCLKKINTKNKAKLKEIKNKIYSIDDFYSKNDHRDDIKKILYNIGYLNDFNSFFRLKQILNPERTIILLLKKLKNSKFKLFQFYGVEPKENKKWLEFEFNGDYRYTSINSNIGIAHYFKSYSRKSKFRLAISNNNEGLLDIKLFLEASFLSVVGKAKPLRLFGERLILLPGPQRVYIFKNQKND